MTRPSPSSATSTSSPRAGTVVPLRRHASYASGHPGLSVQGTLALDLVPRRTPPALELAERAPLLEPQGLPVGTRAELEVWAGRFAQAAVEIVGGDRPSSQLLRWTSAEVYADLRRRATLVARAGGYDPGVARVQPVRPKVVSVRAAFPAPDVAEVCTRIRYGERSRAVAARFDVRRGRWVCTALEFA